MIWHHTISIIQHIKKHRNNKNTIQCIFYIPKHCTIQTSRCNTTNQTRKYNIKLYNTCNTTWNATTQYNTKLEHNITQRNKIQQRTMQYYTTWNNTILCKTHITQHKAQLVTFCEKNRKKLRETLCNVKLCCVLLNCFILLCFVVRSIVLCAKKKKKLVLKWKQ